jgi:hypothetical protein
MGVVSSKLAEIRGTTSDAVAADKLKKLLRHDFHFEHVDRFTGEKYVGDFVSVIPNYAQQLEIEVLTSKLLVGMNVSNVTSTGVSIARVLSVCSVCLEKKPEWFSEDKVYDAEVMSGVYEEVVRHQNGFFRDAEQRDENKGSGEVDLPEKA